MPEEATAESTPPPLPPSPLEKLNDFPDRLSPMLVKELRQGLRTHSFVILFLILQGLLALILLTIAAANPKAGGVVSSIIFCFFSFAVLLVQPLRGMSAISSEVKSDTIDLMSLTRLSAWRIVFGKWSSIMGQTGLFLFAVIPYLILRYFFGGMQLFSELLLFFSIFLLSGVFTAITVGLSASTLALIRSLPLFLGLLLIFIIPNLSFAELDSVLEAFTPKTPSHSLSLIGTYLISGFVGYFFLELAATAIAPSSENRATRKRLISLVVIPLAFAALHTVEPEMAWFVTLLLLTLVSLDFFTENQDYPSVVMRPFLRFGPLGSFAARFLTPGWATGTLFHLSLTSLIILLSLAMGKELRDPNNLSAWIGLGIVLGTLYLSNLLGQIFQKKFSSRLVAYIIFISMLGLLLPLLSILSSIGEVETVAWAFCLLPPAQVFLFDNAKDSTIILVTWITAGLYIFGCIAYAFKPLVQLSKLEREKFDSLDNEANNK